MAYNVFVSHSMKKRDLKIVNEMVQQARVQGINCYLAERDWQFGEPLPAKIENAIRNCDCFVALWTKGGSHSKYVNQEIGVAIGARKHRVLVVESGIVVEGFDIDKEHIILDRRKPFEAITALNTHLSKLKAGKDLVMALGFLLIAILGLILLLTSGKESEAPPKKLPSLPKGAV